MKRWFALVWLCFGCGATPRPHADPGPLQRTAKAGEELTFDASASTGTITKYTWDFGDNSALVEEKIAKHTFASNGDFTATLTVRGPGGAHSAAVLVNVGAGCSANAMITVVTTNPMPNQTVVLGSSGSTGCNGAALTTWEWDFGDGSALVTGDSSKQTISHTWATMGTYVVKLRVVDADGNEGRASRSLGIGVTSSGKPLVTCAMNLSAVINRPISLTASGSDPNGMSLTYAWTFSEGGTGTGSNVMHTYSATGMFTATVIATSTDSRSSDPCTSHVTVTAPPDYTGTWVLTQNGNNFKNACPFTVDFPTSVVNVFHLAATDGGADQLFVTPNGGTYPAGHDLSGTSDAPGSASFHVTSSTPNETPTGCGMAMQTSHDIRMTFSNATTVSGAWTKQYNGCVMLSCIDCNCVAGGSTNGTFAGFKQ